MSGAQENARAAGPLTDGARTGAGASARRPAPRTSRRGLLGAAALAGAGLVGAAATDTGAAMARQGTPTQTVIGQAEAPAWAFGVYAIQDPYAGQIIQPQTAPAGTRYIAAEVQIDNASDQPLNFNPLEIRLRDAAGTEYRGGSAVGSEAYLSSRNLNGGERSHGWVWFTVPLEVQIVEIAYYGPQPVFKVALP
jgi:hypothetical protein